MAEFMILENDDDDVRRRKVYCPLQNLLIEVENQLQDNQLIKLYRFDAEGINYIVRLVEDGIRHLTNRSRAVLPQIQVLATLQYLAGNACQLEIDNNFSLTQCTILNCVDRVTASLCRQMDDFVHFPRNNVAWREMKHSFFNRFGFPNKY